MKAYLCIDDIIEYYNIYNHNTAFSAAQKQEILQEISAMVEDNKRKEKMYYHLQYGLLDIKDDHIPDDGIGAFLMALSEVKQYVQWEWREYNARTQHYKRLYQNVENLEVLRMTTLPSIKNSTRLRNSSIRRLTATLTRMTRRERHCELCT
jgi:hypothetical protein